MSNNCETLKAIKGNIIYPNTAKEISVFRNGCIVYGNDDSDNEIGVIKGVYEQLPKNLANILTTDYGDSLIIPGFIDLHTHAPQFMQRGIGIDQELIQWLKQYTFPSERMFIDTELAKDIYQKFIDALIRKGTTRASILATIHKESTDVLFKIAIDKGFAGLVGKTNMDQNCPDYLKENTQQSLYATEELIDRYSDHSSVQPIITPRFAPTCSKELLIGLGKLAQQYRTPVQSHLSENVDEVKWVKDIYPQHRSYGDIYDSYGLLGETPTMMAHCIYLDEYDIGLLAKRKVTAVHCPQANMNLASGLMPARKWQQLGITVGLGTDVGAGHELAMNKIMVQAIQNSKLIKSNQSLDYKPYTYKEAFYLGTKGNGQFFNALESYQQKNLKVGSLEEGYILDALIIDDENLGSTDISLEERLQRFLYIGDDRNIISRYINGNQIEL
ncbi:amidohydrolase family protein [Desulfuribacillus alkaliarsenatis]|uniref:Amidohydrolase-related domain-containing protein n=1 Tax=Desulfuribacillus alkaliarsenatis TaxID=766136 RepID=A0A1E5G391_9FIRM|nr:amidohydrolase family protein [Desulfuribacillus alkaliarsenatis]OEF97546.1 hypothetical protein BHF68_04895 [Desulfuribacillus alkaliarsenatis]